MNIVLGIPTRWTLQPQRLLRVTMSSRGLTRSSFILFQVHSRFENVTVSFDKRATYGNAVSGRDVGVVSMRNDTKESHVWYMKSSSSTAIDVIMVVTPYAKGGRSAQSKKQTLLVNYTKYTVCFINAG